MKHGQMKRLVAMMLVLAFALSCVACTTTASVEQAEAPQAAEQATTVAEAAEATAADNSLARIVLAKNVNILDGNECSSLVFTFIFEVVEPLVKLGVDGTLLPSLATSWEQLDDYTWRFELREGVKFHDGSDFTSADACYTLNFLATKDPSFKYKAKWSKAWPISAEPDGDYALILKTSAPCFETPGLLTRMGMWPEGAGEEGVYDEFCKMPNGTGAYKVESYTLSENVTLVKNENYWGEEAIIERLSFDIMVDETARSIAVQSGEYDLILGVNYADAVLLEEENNEFGMELMQVESTGMQYIFFNGRSPNKFIQDPNFRIAMTYAIDHEGIREALLYGYPPQARGVTAIVDNINNTYEGEPYPEYDPAKAMELAKACGYNGEEIILYFIEGQFMNGMEVTETVVSQLVDAGFNVTMKEVDSASWSSVRPTSEYDIALNSCSGSFTGQPTDYITQVLGVSAGWSWEDTDALVAECYAEGATEETFATNLPEALKRIWERKPYLWAVENVFLYAVNPSLKNIETLATGYVRMAGAYFE